MALRTTHEETIAPALCSQKNNNKKEKEKILPFPLYFD